jgi:hypothetical protein
MKAAVGILLCLMLMGCAAGSSGGVVAKRVNVEQVAYAGFAQSIRISSGSVEAIVVPQVGGRLMRFGTIGGSNLLWQNPRDPELDAGTYRNWGGEKSWPWPQDEWPRRYGRAWPPASEAELDPYEVQLLSDGAKLTSRPVPGYDLRLVRQFRMDAQTSELIEEMSFEPAGPAASESPTGVWSIAEVPITGQVFARNAGSLRRLGFSGKAWEHATTGNIMVLQRPDVESKIGMDADLLAVAIGQQLLTIESKQVTPAPSKYIAGERAQLYTKPDASKQRGGLPGFTELEFTSPKGVVGTELVSMKLIWRIESLTGAEASDSGAIARRIAQRAK